MMRICQKHWDALRAALDARGIGHLGAKTDDDARRAIVTELEGRRDENDFDPLMSANWMIFSKALELGGLAAMGLNEHGEQYCPVCLALKCCKVGGEDGFRDLAHVESHWIDGPADAMLAVAKEKGLV